MLLVSLLISSCGEWNDNPNPYPVNFDVSGLAVQHQALFIAAASDREQELQFKAFSFSLSGPSFVTMELLPPDSLAITRFYPNGMVSISFSLRVIWPDSCFYDASLHELNHVLGVDHDGLHFIGCAIFPW